MSHQVSLQKTLSLHRFQGFGELITQKTGVEATYLLLRLSLECGQGLPLWGHPSPLGASHLCPELSSCRRRKQQGPSSILTQRCSVPDSGLITKHLSAGVETGQEGPSAPEETISRQRLGDRGWTVQPAEPSKPKPLEESTLLSNSRDQKPTAFK